MSWTCPSPKTPIDPQADRVTLLHGIRGVPGTRGPLFWHCTQGLATSLTATSLWPHHDFWPGKQPKETVKLPDRREGGGWGQEEVPAGWQGQEEVPGR